VAANSGVAFEGTGPYCFYEIEESWRQALEG
jgi:hypothetical protein